MAGGTGAGVSCVSLPFKGTGTQKRASTQACIEGLLINIPIAVPVKPQDFQSSMFIIRNTGGSDPCGTSGVEIVSVNHLTLRDYLGR